MRKQYILYIVAITILFSLMITIDNNSYINSNNNVSALDYSSNIGIGFTFNPTLSISLSSSDLTIDNLKPGTTENSNSINVSVATNAAYGYMLSTNVGDDIHNNSNLTHTNNTDIFSSIATDANLSSLDDSDESNIWGYSYKNNIASTPTWSNYSGLSNSVNKALFNTDSNAGGSIDFKIAAKASSTQPSGEYTGTINFIAITKPTPMNLAESYFAHGKTRHNGYYTMQDMTTEICNDTEVIGEGSQTELIDIRDNKVYWATKLADNHCWMTQNLDLDLDSNRTYTHWDTDLGWTVMDEEAEWKPERSTINFSGTAVDEWKYNGYTSYSANPGNIYYYTSNSDADDIRYNSLQECISAGHDDCTHYHAGNYYNWSAAVANNDTSNLVEQYENAPNSVCPTNWRLPISTNQNKELEALLTDQNIIKQYGFYEDGGFNFIRKNPVYFARAGYIRPANPAELAHTSFRGYYMTSTVWNNIQTVTFAFFNNRVYSGTNSDDSMRRASGIPVRCLAR